jgi:peptide/nickel transport system substrate-binding protein
MKFHRLSSLIIITMILLTTVAFITPNVYAQAPPRGPWVDEITFITEEDMAKALDMLKKNEIQVYFDDFGDPELFKDIKASGLRYVAVYGLYYELTFNPYGPEFTTGELNPFSVPRIREAMNYIVDRSYIANEIMGGLAVPRYTALAPSFPEYARYADTIFGIEDEYKYNFEKGKSIIFEEMKKLGAEYRDGKWYYKGKEVVIKFLIRVEDARKAIGDYVATQLEKLGFTVERMYKTGREASPIWLRGDPAKGEWHIYTGGWITTQVVREEADNFGYFYTPLGRPEPLWQAYKPDPEFYEVAQKLWNRLYASVEERDELMKKALLLSMKDSARVWLVHLTTPWASRPEVTLSYDLAGGFSGSRLWPYTIRYVDRVGGSMKIALPNLLVDPWNPIAGSNWIFDQAIIRATSDPAVMPDPYTGLYWPNRIKKAEVYVVKGLPVTKTLNWVDLKFVDEIEVPSDAWYGWNASTKQMVPPPPNTTAKAKVVLYYEDDLFRKVKWHDGSTLSIGDILLSFILTFDRADPASPIYDEAYVPAFEAFREIFKGLKIISIDPLVIEYYTDAIYLDAEWIAASAVLWPEYAQGPGPWHVLAVAWLAEAEKKLAFSADKADALKVEWMNLISGPSLDELKSMLDRAIAEDFIPYEEFLGRYVTKDEAKTRYANLRKWVDAKGHFWVGNGPFYLDKVDVIAKIVTIKAFREFPDTADKWARFAEPMISEVDVTVPLTITPGQAIEFNIDITCRGVPYKVDDIMYVKYIIRHGNKTKIGMATPITDGKWVIRLSAEESKELTPGSAELIVIVVSKLVGVPTIVRQPFIILTPSPSPSPSPSPTPGVVVTATVTKPITAVTTVAVTTTTLRETVPITVTQTTTEWTTTIVLAVALFATGFATAWFITKKTK